MYAPRQPLISTIVVGLVLAFILAADAFEGGQVVAQARSINPTLPIIARSHSDEKTEHLEKHGATRVIMGEQEIATAMLANLSSAMN